MTYTHFSLVQQLCTYFIILCIHLQPCIINQSGDETSSLNPVRTKTCNAVIHAGGQQQQILLKGKEQGPYATKGFKMLWCEKVTEERVKWPVLIYPQKTNIASIWALAGSSVEP